MSVHSARLRTMLLAGAAVACVAGPAWAQTRTFSIPSQPAVSGVPEFARQAGIQILVAEAAVEGRRTSAVQGAYSVDEGLRRLLAGTGLEVAVNDGRTVTLRRAVDPQSASAGEGAEATSVDAVIVTAQKKTERIQDVPIAISAFSAQTLEAQKIEGGFDLVKAVPNVTFSKSNYSGYNFSIRGIGTKAVSATSDPGVAISFNNTTLIRNRLFEQEYFDVERVEVLRGPQGTLYGRNATAGVVNMITERPDFGAFAGSVRAEIGNNESRRLVGIVNLPISDDLAVRFAGSATERSGFAKNTLTGNDIDSRDLWSTRLSIAWRPTDRFRADLVWEHFDEDDSRLRTGKQLCHRDEGPASLPGVDPANLNLLMRGRLSQGCRPGSLYSDDAYQAPNGFSIPFIVAGQMTALLGYDMPGDQPGAQRVGILQMGVDPFNTTQSRDLRSLASAYDPAYRAKADIVALTVSFDLTDNLTVTSQTLYNEDQVWSFQDYHRFETLPTFNDSSGLYNALFNGQWSDPSIFQGLMPGGIYTDPQIGPADRLMGFEVSSSDSTQFSQEFRLQSAFDGPLNFNVGANYTTFEGLNDYFLFYNIVSAIAQVQYNRSSDYTTCNNDPVCVRIDPNPLGTLAGDGHNYFRNKNPYELESSAIFGELYWQVADTLKLTGGLRHTQDRKTFTPWLSQLMQPGYGYGPAEPIKQAWSETTGRLGFDWRPDLPLTDETMVYGFYSRGYKAGGANPPPVDTSQGFPLPVENPVTFDPEFVDAFEVGIKNTLLNGSLILNGSAFYYDYEGYQVSKVVNRTVVNENFNARIWGAELEAVWRPSPELRLNASVGYLQTEVGDGEQSIDIFNRTQGDPDWMVVTPWLQQVSNCILPTEVVAQLVNVGMGNAPYDPIFLACLGWQFPLLAGLGFDPAAHPDANNGTGFYADLSGNELPNAPHWTFSMGAEYTWRAGDWEATLRGDYYRQTDSYARVYNTVADRLRGWDNANLSLTISRPADDLTFQVYAKNIFDDTPITDAFLNSDSTGMTTNVFTLDPRLIGVSITKGF